MNGRPALKGWKRTALAAILAYALVLQGVLAALGGAMHAAPADLPESVLCLEAGDAGPAHQPASSGTGSDHALCCIMGCSGVPISAGPAPAATGLSPSFPALASLRPAAMFMGPVVAVSIPPVGSRAPPRFV